ncbi:hypothetical protein GLOTRDRAFT_129390 [Gloeophyllum trabeum ATCC 11539]|uniref:Uncharacterized protein n=1 Tax=Gloeophyllum trabeum (strain ATCC 11539 / FP-39264 / Madison 617) TaxID=670483 RepID=S7RQE1_GLOTA|nr:uncharacterized protein GLOTRDRAFT_129390 [Gloeophyllum trabeum ATCC 11539]EPQ55099.1 hypothetical protein GLOTRDRAFT_129390 [Gloeophyllum trabeum ATCC 11539]
MRLSWEAVTRSRDLLIKEGMPVWDTTPFFDLPGEETSAPAQPTSRVGPHLLLRQILLVDGHVYEDTDYIHSAMEGASYKLERPGLRKPLQLDESGLEEQLAEVLPQED